jgi:hypothetical protein
MAALRDLQEKDRQAAISLLIEQLRVDGSLVGLYEKIAEDVQSIPVRHLLHTI